MQERDKKTFGTYIFRNRLMLYCCLKPLQEEFELDIACITKPNIQTCPTCMFILNHMMKNCYFSRYFEQNNKNTFNQSYDNSILFL